MTPFKQLHLHKPEEGVNGDCWRTAIGCLLDLPPEEVPHFYPIGATNGEVEARTDEFLAARGLRLLKVRFPGDSPMEDVLRFVASQNPGVHHLFSGASRNGQNHVVIARDGAIVHDTALDNSGIVGPLDNGTWLVEFLGARV